MVTSKNDNSVQTNAIDPSVVVTPGGEHWMVYGSAWDGIYSLKLDPATGFASSAGDKGKRIANRGFTAGKYNGNIEGADLLYNSQLNKYFLFIAYDWLQTKYNVRVMKSDKPDGSFYDFNGTDANTNIDHGPMIIAPRHNVQAKQRATHLLSRIIYAHADSYNNCQLPVFPGGQ